MNEWVSYEDLIRMCGQGRQKVDELVTYVLGLRTGEGQTYQVENAFVVVLGDVLLALGIEQLNVVAYLNWVASTLQTAVGEIRVRAGKVDQGIDKTVPWLIVQILEGRWAVYPDMPVYDLQERQVTSELPVPTVSVALNVTMLWLRTVAKSLGLDSVAERTLAGREVRESGSERSP